MVNTLNTNQIKGILNAFKDFEITPLQFFHGLLGTKIFEDHPTTLISCTVHLRGGGELMPELLAGAAVELMLY